MNYEEVMIYFTSLCGLNQYLFFWKRNDHFFFYFYCDLLPRYYE